MWNERLKQKLKQLGVTYEEAAKSCGMKKDGFYSAINKGSIKYDKMIQLAEKYKFSLDELRFSKGDARVEEAEEKYQLLGKKHDFEREILIPRQVYEDMKKHYEDTIKNNKDQILFLQRLIEKDENKKSKGNNIQGAKSA